LAQHRAGRAAARAAGTDRRSPNGPLATRIAESVLSALPQGQLLPDRSWRVRHRWIVALLWVQAAGLVALGASQGYGVVHSALDSGVVAVAATLASIRPLGRKARSLIASFGLISTSALLVHLWGGRSRPTSTSSSSSRF